MIINGNIICVCVCVCVYIYIYIYTPSRIVLVVYTLPWVSLLSFKKKGGGLSLVVPLFHNSLLFLFATTIVVLQGILHSTLWGTKIAKIYIQLLISTGILWGVSVYLRTDKITRTYGTQQRSV